MPWEQIVPIASLLVALATVIFTTFLLARQIRAMEHERNALALLEAIGRMTSNEVVDAFAILKGVETRYPTDEDLQTRFPGSAEERALFVVGQFIETVATLARRGVLDPSLIVDAVGWQIRTRWATIEPFTMHRRRFHSNPYLYENFEWLARYSDWWKDVPRPRGDPNYWPDQFQRRRVGPR